MRLVPREQDKLMLHYAGMLARDRKAKGLKLNYPEAVAYISMEVMEKARAGASAAELMQYGTKLLTADDVMDGVPEMIHEIQIESTMPAGTAVRFEPGEKKTVRLIPIGGDRIGYGLNGLVNGKMDDENIMQAAFEKAKKLGFKGV